MFENLATATLAFSKKDPNVAVALGLFEANEKYWLSNAQLSQHLPGLTQIQIGKAMIAAGFTKRVKWMKGNRPTRGWEVRLK